MHLKCGLVGPRSPSGDGRPFYGEKLTEIRYLVYLLCVSRLEFLRWAAVEYNSGLQRSLQLKFMEIRFSPKIYLFWPINIFTTGGFNGSGLLWSDLIFQLRNDKIEPCQN